MPDLLGARLRNILKKSESAPAVTDTQAQATPPDAVPDEPASLALRIQGLIDHLPVPTKPIHVNSPKPPKRDKDGKPIPPAVPIKDSKLVAILSSATIMNGSRNGRPSIWSVLEGLGAPKHDEDTTEDTPHGDSDQIPDIFSESSSVMVYSPLLPTRDSLVELADSEIITEEGQTEEPESAPPEPPIPGWAWANIVPSLTSWFPQAPSPPLVDEDGRPLTPRTHERRLRAQATRVWVPSKDKLSIQTMWWGYRMFLPPHIMDILDDKQLEAAKRAAMITTALTWFFNNIPVNAVPLPIRPTLLLLQRIAPYLGYIGTFISWSWSTIKGYDKGFGVILTATWLLPVALIPGTWNERDWPITPPTAPVPLPSDPQSPTSPPVSLPPNQAPSSPAPLPAPAPPLPTPTSPPTGPASPLPPPSIPISSPATSFATAPSSPATPSSPSLPTPTSPKRVRTSLASLVAKSPIIRVHQLTKTKSGSPSSPSQPTPPQTETKLPTPTSSTAPSPIKATPSTATEELMMPSPPANPNDLRLLQSPILQCSPLPPEHARHPALPPETEQTSTKEERKWKKGFKKSFLKVRR